MRILIAPDKFKDSLGAEAVGQAIAAGCRAVLPTAEIEIEIVPVADGGEGTAGVIALAQNGTWKYCPTHDALGRAMEARYAWIDSLGQAVIEMSAVAGRALLAPEKRRPLQLSTFGVGEMLRHAAAQDPLQIVVGLGGSATNDGGYGFARALGFRFLDRAGHNLAEEVSALTDLDQIVPPNDLDLPSVVAACDVRNPLLGPEGATRVFGPQKGADPAEIEILERALMRLADIAAQTIGRDQRDAPGAGAAGGLGFGLATFARAELRPGFDVVAEAVGLRERIERADFVVTGEGKLDGQTLAGKAPAGVARLARELGKPVYAIVGQAMNEPAVRSLFDAVLTLDDLSPDFRDTSSLLETRARELALRLR